MKRLMFLFAFLIVLFALSPVSAQDKPLYGYSEGYFYVHKSLVSVVSNEAPEIITRVTSGKPMVMTLVGDEWMFYTKKKLGSTEKYCFKVGEEYIPYVFLSEWEHPAKEYKNMINSADVIDNGMGGFDFRTAKQ